MRGKYDPIMVTPQCFTHLTSNTIALREQIAANSDLHTMSDPLGTPGGVLFTGFYDFQESAVKKHWEESNDNR